MNNKKGRLIVIEGACDGIGKSTQLEMLKKEFGSDCYTHHFLSDFHCFLKMDLLWNQFRSDFRYIPVPVRSLHSPVLPTNEKLPVHNL